MNEVIVSAYPKSGVTWLLRLICDLLEAQHQDTPQMEPLSYGHPVRGGWVVRKTHYPYWEQIKAIVKNRIVVFIQRDPRDVVVSAMHYGGSKDLKRSINSMVGGSYVDYLESWFKPVEPLKVKKLITTRYEWLHSDPIAELCHITFELTGKTLSDERIQEAISRQSFENMSKQFNDGGHFMRKGIVGDWRSHFDRETAQTFNDHFGEFMLEQGYVDDLDWWKEL